MVWALPIGFGLIMFIFGLADQFKTRPHFVGSSPNLANSWPLLQPRNCHWDNLHLGWMMKDLERVFIS